MHYSNWRVVGPVRSVFTFLLTRHYLSSRVLSWPSRAKFPTLPPRSGVWRGADIASMGADRPCILKWGLRFAMLGGVVRRGDNRVAGRCFYKRTSESSASRFA